MTSTAKGETTHVELPPQPARQLRGDRHDAGQIDRLRSREIWRHAVETREAVLAAITSDGSDEEAEGEGRDLVANRAVALKAVLPGAGAGFTPGERALLS